MIYVLKMVRHSHTPHTPHCDRMCIVESILRNNTDNLNFGTNTHSLESRTQRQPEVNFIDNNAVVNSAQWLLKVKNLL